MVWTVVCAHVRAGTDVSTSPAGVCRRGPSGLARLARGPQWWKRRTPEKAIVMPYWSAAAITSESPTEPPAATTYSTPRVEATSIESRKGKKASDASETPSSVLRYADFSAAVSSSGSDSKLVSHCARTAAPDRV